jgi:amino acid adenylation domain-containing protein
MLELVTNSKINQSYSVQNLNNIQTKYPKDKCIHQLFEEQVKKTPDAVAIRFQEEYLTYFELNNQANQLARYLQGLGVGPEVIVGICLERSLSMFISLLAVLKAGGAYVPIDIKYPKDRIACILEDAQIHLLLTEEWLEEKLPEHSSKIVYLEAAAKNINSESTVNLPNHSTPDNLMYVLFTSGSTGRPKGVEIVHRSVVNLLTSMVQEPGITKDDVILAITTLSFDMAVVEIYLPLIVGAQAVIVSSEVAANGTELLKVINTNGITFMQATPASWRLLLNAGWSGSNKLKIVCGGEPLPKILATQLLERVSELWNLYGPTETTVWSTAYRVEDDSKSTIIGHPIANTQIYILDENLQPTPTGIPGELFIGGDGLARGYRNRPQLTSEKFISDFFSVNPEARIYRTGDLARFLEDGTIECLGRIDHQVKIRGFRIELGEIETALCNYSTVKEAVVVAHEYNSGDKRLVAYVVPKPGQSVITTELHEFLKAKLPEYMVPFAYIVMDFLPLTPNNKVDRRALPKPDKVNLNSHDAYLSPQNDIEVKLVQIWENILRIQPIGINDNFFSLGGNSLLAGYLVLEIEKVFAKTLNPGILFEAPTIKKLAVFINDNPDLSTTSSLVKFQENGKKPPLFIIANDSFLYKNVVPYLDKEQPVYFIKEELTYTSEMAANCLKIIRKIKPYGPYRLLGHSFEGLVAYEIAQQLHAGNEQVDWLGLIDTPTPNVEIAIEKRSSLNKIWQRLKIISKLSSVDKISFLKERIQHRLKDSFQPLISVLKEFTSEYIPQKYLGELTLFTATFEFYVHEDKKLGWNKLASKGVKTYNIPASHRSILLEPSKAQVLAQHLNDCLK